MRITHTIFNCWYGSIDAELAGDIAPYSYTFHMWGTFSTWLIEECFRVRILYRIYPKMDSWCAYWQADILDATDYISQKHSASYIATCQNKQS